MMKETGGGLIVMRTVVEMIQISAIKLASRED